MTLHYKQNNHIAHELLENSKVSIQLSLDGFSFCITKNQTIIALSHYIFEQTCKNYHEILEKIIVIFNNETLLQNNFKTVQVIHSNNLATFVPTAIFDKEKTSDYLQYTIKTLDNDFITFDTMDTANITNVYIPFVNVNNFFFEKFGTFKYKHIATVLAENLLLISKNSNTIQFYVHFQEHDFQIIVISENNLQFYNTFSYATNQDVIYYILFTLEQLKLNPETINLTLVGAILEDSENYKIIFKYIRNVVFLDTKYLMDTAIKTIPSHTLFTLRKN